MNCPRQKVASHAGVAFLPTYLKSHQSLSSSGKKNSTGRNQYGPIKWLHVSAPPVQAPPSAGASETDTGGLAYVGADSNYPRSSSFQIRSAQCKLRMFARCFQYLKKFRNSMDKVNIERYNFHSSTRSTDNCIFHPADSW